MNTPTILAVYLVFVNITAFLLMGIDKQRARRHAFRVPEAVLFAFALCGGSIGAICGMWLYAHKTKKKRFVFGLPLILLVQIVLIVIFLSGFDIVKFY